MLTALRRLASTWVAKALFVLLVLSFGIWGIGDTVRNLGRDTALVRVNGQPRPVQVRDRSVKVADTVRQVFARVRHVVVPALRPTTFFLVVINLIALALNVASALASAERAASSTAASSPRRSSSVAQSRTGSESPVPSLSY